MNNYTVYGIYDNDILLYIGSSANYKSRVNNHLQAIKNNNTNSKIKLYQYIKKNKLNVDIESIYSDNCSKDEIAIVESHYIKTLKPLLNIRQPIKLSTRYRLKEYQKMKYQYRKYIKEEIKQLMNIII